MFTRKYFLLPALPLALQLVFSTTVFAESAHHHHGDGSSSHTPAPIGVMGDHLHKQGEWMFSYRYMYMDMDGNRNGDNRLSTEEVITLPNNLSGPPTLRVVPTKMSMQMHMLGAMYAPTDNVTLMVMTNLIEKEMDHVTYMGMAGNTVLGNFTTKTEGLGDTSVSALVRLNQKVHATVGISLPTGSIDESDDVLTPMGPNNLRLPYPMQLGSGTYDLIAGITLNDHKGLWSFGSQFKAVVRLGENDENYSLGNEFHATSWLGRAITDELSWNARVAFLSRGNIDGQDPLIDAPVQTADPDRQALDRVDVNAGLNWLLPDEKNRLALEVGVPVYQKVDGPQLETDLQLTFGWQLAI